MPICLFIENMLKYMKTIVFLWCALMVLPSCGEGEEAARIHVDCVESWKTTRKKVIAAFADSGRVMLKYRGDEIDINPNGYENELDFVVAGKETPQERIRNPEKTELRKLKRRPGYAIYQRVDAGRENIEDSILHIKKICRDSKVKVEGVVLMVYINDAEKTHVLCDVLKHYEKGLAPIKRVGVLIVANME